MSTKHIHLVVSVAFQDAGDTTRAIAITSAFRALCPPDIVLEIDFLSCGSRLEYKIRDAGFNIVPAQPRVKGISVADDLGWDFPEFFGSKEIAKEFIEGQLEAFKKLKPDVVFHGMWAPASLAARMLGIPTINFLPLPVCEQAFGKGLIRDIPDIVPVLTRLPRPMRQKLAWWGSNLMLRAPTMRQHRLGAAAAECGWPVEGPMSLFEMNMADLNLINDLPMFHAAYAHRLPKNFVITGPLFARSTQELDHDIAAHMMQPGPSILVTMGSCGTKELMFPVIEALKMNKADDWHAVILVPPHVCSIEQARALACDPRLFVTDRFIPTTTANELADVTIIHGGQGTVQTAMASGKPIVGVALQVEQQTNLDAVMDAGAGIRIQRQCWNSKTINRAVKTVLENPSYRMRAHSLAGALLKEDGAQRAAEVMWDFVREVRVGKMEFDIELMVKN